jgi:hypothetical protein
MKATSLRSLFILSLFWGISLSQPHLVQSQTIESTQGSKVEVDFAKEVQPLLARRCFACHGPDDAEGGLRLDSREAALAELESGAFAIVPEKADESALLERIASHEEDVRMPPEGKPLTQQEQDTLRRWIEAGAPWRQHWAFEPIVKPELPAPVAGSTSRHPVDAFIDAKLQSKGLTRPEPASPVAIIRRLSFDLTGLPPTPEQVANFVTAAQTNFDQAYEQEVDRLLASPQYGERWARHWLDVVRYAETNSFERDGAKPNAWRYRDYVIRSFNDDKPYDEFLREQLAGDELPEVTKDSLIATGLYRLGVWDDEPADRELAAYDSYDDILTTVGQGLLAMTVNCCRCHDHKIDPIPATDYYSMLSFFRGVTPNGNGPNVIRPLTANEADREQLRRTEQDIREKGDQLQMQLTKFEQELKAQIVARTSTDAATSDLDQLEYRYYRDSFKSLPKFDELKAEETGKLERPYFDISLATRPDQFGFVFTGTLVVPADGEYGFVLDSDDGSRLTIDGKMIVEYDGIHGMGDAKIGKATLTQGRHPIRLDYFQGQHGKGLTLSWSGPGFKRRWLTPSSSQTTQDLNQALNSPLADELDPTMVADYRRVKRELEENSRRKPWEEYGLCVSERGVDAPETFVLLRGSPEALGEKVEPKFLSVLGGEVPKIVPNPAANTSGRRLAFANWVTAPENRLTSRVIVNRIWQHHFGRGIVRSSNNFGQLGDAPTHPELLDWLAANLIENGWRLKPLHKLLLMSQTYRQSSLASDEALVKDPNNDLFSRFNMRRLSAEEVRDSILATNDRLNPEMFGPSVFPEISKEVLAGQSVPGSGWSQSSEEDQARRSIYIHIKRSLVVPLLSSFDFPETDASCEARFITTQPGQALGMLNGDFLNEEAEALAIRLRKEAGNEVANQIQRAYQLAFARSATKEEVDRAILLINDLQKEHQLNADQALSYFCLFVYNLNEFIYLD